MNKYFTAIRVCGSLLLAQLPSPAFAARRVFPGGIAAIDCVIHENGTEVLWNVRIDDSSKPMLIYNFDVKVGGGERNRNFTGVGSFTSISKSVIFEGYRKNVAATLEGTARGANGRVLYVYTVKSFPADCIPSHQGKSD